MNNEEVRKKISDIPRLIKARPWWKQGLLDEYDKSTCNTPRKPIIHNKRPFPRPCYECGKLDVWPTTIDYKAEVKHGGQLYKFDITGLQVIQCRSCNEIYFDAVADEQISQALEVIMEDSTPVFKPFVYYDPDGDCLEVVLSMDNFYGEYVNKNLVTYHKHVTDELVGLMIDNVSQLCKKITEE